MKRFLYVVSSGHYSDYRINAIFSSKKLAEDFMSAVKDDDYNEIEVYELNPQTADLIKRGYSVWIVHMLKNGDIETVIRTDNDLFNVDDTKCFVWERTKAPIYIGKNIQDILVAKVWAKTEKQAIKIANEKRIMMTASGEFK